MISLIAVTCDRRGYRAASRPNAAGRVRPKRAEIHVGEHVVTLLRQAGAEPLLLPPHDGDPSALIAQILRLCAGVVITGGAFDIHPARYGQTVETRLDRVDEGRTGLELELASACLSTDTPLLGLCGGMQILAVAAGGTLVQDISAEIPDALEHEQPTDPAESWHPVLLERGHLRAAYGRREIAVNSTHHQAVRDPGRLRITGRSPDGVVEAIELDEHPFAVGVQWHPELLGATPLDALVAAARRARPPA